MNYTMSQKKEATLNFCLDIFTIFEAACLGIISAWYSLLRTTIYLCEAFIWRDVTHDVSEAVAHSAHWHWIP